MGKKKSRILQKWLGRKLHSAEVSPQRVDGGNWSAEINESLIAPAGCSGFYPLGRVGGKAAFGEEESAQAP